MIDTSAEPPRLRELAQTAGLSASHLHREFKKLLGITPREYADGKRINRLQAALSAGETVAQAIYAAGYGSGSRVYEDSRRALGMTPGAYRAGGQGQSIAYSVVDSPLGPLLVAATDKGVCCIEFGENRAALRRQLAGRFPCAKLDEDEGTLAGWVSKVIKYLNKPLETIDIPLDIQGSAFQRLVWQALRTIPAGSTASYQDIAAAIGRPTAARAVARACGSNRLALAIPCHRVVRSDGALSGYRWGVQRKQALLDGERAAAGAAKKTTETRRRRSG